MVLNPRWIFLDFDGVIMDSMSLKLDAYCHALAEYGFPRGKVREQQLLYAGLSRSRALPLMYAGLTGGGTLSEEAQARILARFAEEDIRLRPRMRLLPGVEEFLREAERRDIPLAVVTGTPQEVIDGTVDHFGIRGWFREVHGWPPVKADHLAALRARLAPAPGEAIYVGDAVQDHKAAAAAGLPFIAVERGERTFKGLQPEPAAVIQGLIGLPAVLEW